MKLVQLAKKLAVGLLRPLPHVTHSMKNAVAAFRQMSQARHIGKIVVQTEVATGLEQPCRGAVIVTGGTGMIGSLVAGWLTEQGVQHVKLLGRTGKVTGEKASAPGLHCALPVGPDVPVGPQATSTSCWASNRLHPSPSSSTMSQRQRM